MLELVIHVVTFCLFFPILTAGQTCPISSCTCEDNAKGRIINCRDKLLQGFPSITASDEIFYEVTFSSNYGCPSSPRCNNIRSIPSQAFRGLKVKKIDLTKNPIANVASDAFSGLEVHLEELVISGNKQSGFPYSCLTGLSNLKTLEFQEFRQPIIEADNTIKQLGNLESLTLRNIIDLHAISPQAFQDSLPKLTTLKLIGNNRLNFFPTSAVRQLVTLEHLSFSQCGLNYVSPDTFRELSHLVELDLSHNSISTLEEGSFRGINGTLQYLNLFLNNLDESGLQLITNQVWPHLEQLNLGQNRLKNLNNNMFINMPKLQSLKLLHNEIKSLRSNSFAGLTSMYFLDLSFNQIGTIEAGTFSPMKTLGTLFLQSQTKSNVLNLTKEAVAGIENFLEILNLDAIELNEFEIWQLVSDLTNLHELHLKATGITSVPDFVFSKFTKLIHLSLADNSISAVHQESFYGLQDSLHILQLQGNQLTSISECVFWNFKSISQLYLSNNPIHCDCRMRWLFDIITEKIKTSPETEYYFTCTCTNLNNQYLGYVDKTSLVCTDRYVPETCENIYMTTSTETPRPTTVTVGPVMPRLTINTGSITARTDNIGLSWSISNSVDITGYIVTYQVTGETQIDTRVASSITETTLTKLKPGTYYLICITPEVNGIRQEGSKKCVTVPTPKNPDKQSSNDTPIIIGCSVVGGILLIILVIAIVVLRNLCRKSNSDPSSNKPVTGPTFNITEKPKLGQDSRQFYKPKKNNKSDPTKDIQITVISNPDNEGSRVSGGSYQILDFNASQKSSSKPDPDGSYENDVSSRQLPRTPHYSQNSSGYYNKGFNTNDDPANHIYHEPQNTYYDMCETCV